MYRVNQTAYPRIICTEHTIKTTRIIVALCQQYCVQGCVMYWSVGKQNILCDQQILLLEKFHLCHDCNSVSTVKRLFNFHRIY